MYILTVTVIVKNYTAGRHGTPKGANLDAIAFIMPNKNLGATAISGYITTIDEVEKETGLNFMRNLNLKIQDKLEAKMAKMWSN